MIARPGQVRGSGRNEHRTTRGHPGQMIHPWLPPSWRWRPYRHRSRCWRSSTHPDGRKCAALAIAGDQRRAAGRPARCAAAAPARSTRRPRRGNGNRMAAARAAGPARRRSPGPGGPPAASHARRRPAPEPAACAAAASRSPSPASTMRAVFPAWVTCASARRQSPRHKTPCAAPARSARLPALRG